MRATIDIGDKVGFHPVGEDSVRCVGIVRRFEGSTVIVVPVDEPKGTDFEERVPFDRIKALEKA